MLPEPHKYINTIIEKGIIFLLIFTPLAFGTVQPWSIAVMEIIAFTLFFFSLLKRILQNPSVISHQSTALRPLLLTVLSNLSSAFNRHLPSALCLLFFLLCLFQMLPLPETLLKVLSPMSLATYRTFGNNPAGTLHPISLNPDASRQELFRLLAYAATFFVIVSHYRTKDQVHSLVKMLVCMGCFLIVFAIIHKMTWNDRIFWLYPVDLDLRNGNGIWASYINRDHFAGYLEMAIPLAMGLLLYRAPRVSALPDTPLILKISRFMASKNITPYSLLFLLVLLMTATLFATFSRGGMLAFVASSLFFAGITRRRRSLKQKTGFLSLLAAVIFIVVVLASWGRLEDRFADLAEDHVSRLSVWQDSIGIVRDYPVLGTGLGTFKNAYMRYQTSMSRMLFDHAHNDYVELLTDTGIAGFLLGLGIALVFFRNAYRRWRHNHSMFGRCIGAGGLTSLVAMAVHSFVDFNLHIPANALLVVVISAITYAAIFNVSDKKSS